MRLYQYAQVNEILYYSNYNIYTICYVHWKPEDGLIQNKILHPKMEKNTLRFHLWRAVKTPTTEKNTNMD